MKLTRLLAAVAATAALSAGFAAQAREYSVSTVLSDAFPWGQAAQKWAELVNERSAGRITLRVYPNAQLVAGDQTKEFSAMRSGLIDMAVGSTINWSPQVPELNLFSLPFLMKDNADLDAITQGEAGKLSFAAIEQRGIVPLAWGENGYREISNSKHAIKTPADLKGLKIRVVGSPLFLDTFTALGANPTQMSWADAQPAMASGAVDGQENPVSVYMAAKLQSVGQKHLTLWGYINDPLIFVVNKDIWATWTKEDQDIVRQAAVDAAKEQIVIARKGMIEADKPLLKDLAANGVTVTQLTPAEREAFVKATRPVYDKWKQQVGADLVDVAEKAIAARTR